MSVPQLDAVNSPAGKARVLAALALVVAAVAGFYLSSSLGVFAQWAILLIGLAAAVLVFLFSEPGRQFMGFFADSWKEVQKVVWPSRKDTLQFTAYVFVFAVTMAVFLWSTDKILEWVLYDLILGWRK